MNVGRLLSALGLTIGAFGLIVQLAISMNAYLADGRDLPGALGTFFTYYTILTNIVLALIYLSELTNARPLNIFRSPVVRGLMLANMALVMGFVFFVLRHLSVLENWFLICDAILHYITPVLYALWWIFVARHGSLKPAHVPLMLAPTLIYFLYAMARGAWVAEYPHPILNAIELGYPQVLINAVAMTLALGILATVVLALDHLLTQRGSTAHV